MTLCLFAADLHGSVERYEKLFAAIEQRRPAALFLGGDLLPGLLSEMAAGSPHHSDFLREFLAPQFERLRERLGEDYPRVLAILGNDDGRLPEPAMAEGDTRGLWSYVHDRHVELRGHPVYGYCCVPPTPFLLKDWERYDVSRYVDPGCVSPEEGRFSVPPARRVARYATMQSDLERLVGDGDLARAVFLFHSPPYRTKLDRAALDGKMIDHAPLDVHVGSVAIQRLIETRQPWLSLHGHVHESARLTGAWQDAIGRTVMLSAAHDGPELALIEFDLEHPEAASRRLL